MIFVTTLIYLNHFDNSFHFDSHIILENPYVKNLKNLPDFFVDGSTSSSLPQNQTYRPIVTSSTAIGYWFSGKYKPLFFHLDNFIFFLLQGILMFLFFLKFASLFKTKKIVLHCSFSYFILYDSPRNGRNGELYYCPIRYSIYFFCITGMCVVPVFKTTQEIWIVLAFNTLRITGKTYCDNVCSVTFLLYILF